MSKFKIEIDWQEYYYDTLAEAKKVASRYYEVSGIILGIEEVKDEDIQS